MQKIIIFIRGIADWIFWPVLFLNLYKSNRSRAILVVGDEVLLIKEWKDDRYSLPGGGSHKGEDMKDCTVREVKEEVGVSIGTEELIPLGSWNHRTKGINLTLTAFACRLSNKPELKLQKIEVRSAEWVELSKVQDLFAHSHTKDMILAWIEKSKQG